MKKESFAYWLVVIAIAIGFILLCFAFSLAWWFVVLKILCWALPAIGITTIGSWTIAFSWKLVLICSIASAILSGIFKSNTTVKRD